MNTQTHGGNVRRLARENGLDESGLIDFSASINPLGPPAWTRSLLCRELDNLAHYPDIDASALIGAASLRYAHAPEEIVLGNGSSEILHVLARVAGPRRAVIPVPAYAGYEEAATAAGMDVSFLTLEAGRGFALDFAALDAALDVPATVFLGQPGNPTGRTFAAEDLRRLAARRPDCLFVVDEAFADFLPDLDRLYVRRPANVVLLLSLTKFYAVPGLRLGLALAAPDIAASCREQIPPWSVNALAQAFGARALADAAYAGRIRPEVARLSAGLAAGLASLPGLRVFPGQANFHLIRLDRPDRPDGPDRPDLTAPDLAARLLTQGLAIRVCANFKGLDARYFRVAVRTESENARLLTALEAILSGKPAVQRTGGPASRHAPAIMFQGTTSSAGKSVLTAALCRVLLQDGLRVAPFKAQNMSLNSFVTPDGSEIGRAQATQAAACRLEPDWRMNPVLLKPTTDVGSQVIINGRPVANMSVAEYIAHKPQARLAARAAFDSLAGEFEAVVMEGAGSPAEVNLRAHDIVNMDMAEYADARVVITTDIDRGGAFAAIVGTMECLSASERQRVGGFILNRFRGKASLLDEALDFTLARTGRPVLGVVPYLDNLGLPEEDSVAFKEDAGRQGAGRDLDIVLIDLPHVSNFTDADALRQEPDVAVRIVRGPDGLGQPDAVIIPGSKNVLADLAWLTDSGLAGAIRQLAGNGRCEIVGLCGGFQMIGRDIADPDAIESERGRVAGLGLLDAATVLLPAKILRQATGRHAPSGLEVRGYEIHHGVTATAAGATTPVIFGRDGASVGESHPSLPVWGTYLHGVFDADPFRRHFLDGLRIRKGLAPAGRILAVYDIEPALDRLADIFRASVDLTAIRRLLGI